MTPPPRVDVLGLPVDVVDRAGLLDQVRERVRAGHPTTVAYLNVHVANVAHADPALTAFLQQVELCYCDGSGVMLGAKLLGQPLPERMTGADWIWDFAALAEAEGWRVAWIGGEPGVAEQACAALQARHPGLEARGWHGFHDADTVPALLAEVNGFDPQVVLLGMGTPLQEAWAARWRPQLHAPVLWCLGATADFVSGKTDRGPQVLYDNGFEWLARLLTEPGRLWRRYLVGNPWFLSRVLAERARRGLRRSR
ncbi:MAG: WecB/TagA/CpsF family glycosyltransferase [Alphaproteobacteria bacterium]|nr:WecB/TagA/CpsF family glycosyltransferase [Alphaproteobacteria bacterium]